MKKYLGRLLLLVTSLLAVPAHAGPEEQIRAKLKATLPDADITSVEAMPVSGFATGLYLVNSRNYEPVMVTGDGRYLIQGDLLELRNGAISNVSDQMMAVDRAKALAQVKTEDMVIFPAAGGKAKRVIYVFTDPDCGYCRKFHQQVEAINARGIEVRYLAFPRGGLASPVAGKLSSVWCAKDRQRALTDAKRGAALAAAPLACKSPVSQQYALGSGIGVRGTPAIFGQDGMQLGGYLPVDELAKVLQLR
jgi:thiol:disulfide interchange protein DsbC